MGGEGVKEEGGGMVGRGGWGAAERDYTDTYRYTVTNGMTPALRWACSNESHFNVS